MIFIHYKSIKLTYMDVKCKINIIYEQSLLKESKGELKMKAILTVIGKDKVGIIAGVSSELQKLYFRC